MERQQKGKNWLSDPEEHEDDVNLIISKLELDPDFEFGSNNPDQDLSWFDDYENDFRRRIVSDINASIKKKCSTRYPIFKSDSRNKGLYTLIKSIKNIKLTWWQL